ncbi:MAG: class I tRNA ligase family protein, partial [Actinomycetota bacterium]|nr:class I tRNA ligase family protein [Actinomycetota bacterium]
GNVVTPLPLVETHGADAVRYWAASGRPGTDTAVDEGQMKVGRRLAIKILNASRFALGRLAVDGSAVEVPEPGAVTVDLDRALLVRLADVVDESTAALEGYDYARALERTETFFWAFCDDYLELVKARAHSGGDGAGPLSARATLGVALSVQLRLFAPFLPFVTEEVWSWWQPGSIHRAPWPRVGELGFGVARTGSIAERLDASTPSTSTPATAGPTPSALDVASEVLGAIRKAKTAAKRSMRSPVARLVVTGSETQLASFAAAKPDLCEAGGVLSVEVLTRQDVPGPSEPLAVEVVLADDV